MLRFSLVILLFFSFFFFYLLFFTITRDNIFPRLLNNKVSLPLTLFLFLSVYSEVTELVERGSNTIYSLSPLNIPYYPRRAFVSLGIRYRNNKITRASPASTKKTDLLHYTEWTRFLRAEKRLIGKSKLESTSHSETIIDVHTKSLKFQ